jgi:hypothetical protein
MQIAYDIYLHVLHSVSLFILNAFYNFIHYQVKQQQAQSISLSYTSLHWYPFWKFAIGSYYDKIIFIYILN